MATDLAWTREQFRDISNLTVLNRGGQRLVLAGQHSTDGDVVLKLLYPGSDIQRVLREIQAVQRVASPRIPIILDAGTTQSPLGELAWVREQRIIGTDLRGVLERGVLSPTELMRLGLHMLEALCAAESVRIVHRDVKPDNIKVDTSGSYWLLDFGLARHLDLVSLTATDNPFGVGTPGYAPPEQARNRKGEIDGRADLFALGVTLYESAEGLNPLHAEARDNLVVLDRTEHQSIPPIQRPIDAAGEFGDLVQAITRIRREHRPATVASALEWMREICEREGVS